MPRPVRAVFIDLSKESLDSMTDTMTDAQIASTLGGCSKNNVGAFRRSLGVKSFGEKHGISVGVKGVSNPTNRKYHLDETFFASIDSEIKAYALGLLLTDGHITKSLHRVRFSLSAPDAKPLKQIASAVGMEGELLVDKPREGNYQQKSMSILNLNSTLIVKSLLDLGLTSGKDNNVILPSIPSHLDCHMIRGIIDGDGHIATMGSRWDTLLEVSGRKPFLESINSKLESHGLPVLSISSMRSIHRGRCGLWDIALLDWCYGCNPSIVIPRKLERYELAKAFYYRVVKVQ